MTNIRSSDNRLIAEVSSTRKLVQAVSLELESTEDARLFQQAIDQELALSGTRCVLVDARQAKLSSDEVNESMWRWVRTSTSFDRLAIVNRSPQLKVAASMKATAIGTKKVSAFHDYAKAAGWLMAPTKNP